MTDVNTLIEGAKSLGFTLTDEQINKFIIYKETLKDWN